ncbi:MAG: hypothetical protein C5B49_14215 [Bdellovibrio sp.]|nr:MAG: hypothetical protein C5B49_14215 [Bdellovibrio sp.]
MAGSDRQIMAESERQFIKEAADFFHNPGVVARGLAWIGRPLEAAQAQLPQKVQRAISQASRKAVEKALQAAVVSLEGTAAAGSEPGRRSPKSVPWAPPQSHGDFSARLHKGATGLLGVLSGFWGAPGFLLELPLTTVLILRGIADQARLAGHDLNDFEVRLECLMVFCFGTDSPKDDAMESSYFLTRALHAKIIREASVFVSKMSAQQFAEALKTGGAPLLVRLISQVAQAFEVRVTQKFLAEALPVAGALGGAALNFAFTDFYCGVAKYHFGLRQLEKKYSVEFVQQEFRDASRRSSAGGL